MKEDRTINVNTNGNVRFHVETGKTKGKTFLHFQRAKLSIAENPFNNQSRKNHGNSGAFNGFSIKHPFRVRDVMLIHVTLHHKNEVCTTNEPILIHKPYISCPLTWKMCWNRKNVPQGREIYIECYFRNGNWWWSKAQVQWRGISGSIPDNRTIPSLDFPKHQPSSWRIILIKGSHWDPPL